MDQYVGPDDVLDCVQHDRMSCEIANPFDVEMAIAFLYRCGPAAESVVQIIMASTEVFHLSGAQRRERKQQSVPVIIFYLIRSQDLEHVQKLMQSRESPTGRAGEQYLRDSFRARLPDQISVHEANVSVQ